MALGDGVTWAENLPDNSVLAHQIDDYNRDLRVGVRTRMAREHIWTSSQTATNEGGHHNFLTLQMQTAAPTLAGTSGGALWVGTNKAFYFTNSTGTDIMLVNTNFNIPVVVTGTQGSILICSSANPATAITLAASAADYVLTTQTSTGAPAWKAVSPLVTSLFGAPIDKIASYGAQTATSDGIVIVVRTKTTATFEIAGYTDANADPTTKMAEIYGYYPDSTWAMTFNMYVRKGNTWKVVVAAGTASSVYFQPVGV